MKSEARKNKKKRRKERKKERKKDRNVHKKCYMRDPSMLAVHAQAQQLDDRTALRHYCSNRARYLRWNAIWEKTV